MAESLNTRVLIERIQQGDESAVNELLQRYQARILSAVRIRLGARLRAKMQSMDVVQDVMIEALRRVKAVDFPSEGDFMRYLGQVVLHEICDKADYWKAKKRDAKKEVPLSNPRASDSGNPLDTPGATSSLTPSKDFIRQEELELLERAMDLLSEQSEEYRELIVEVKLEGRTYGEIAAETGSTPDAVRMRVNRAEAALAKIYKALDKDK